VFVYLLVEFLGAGHLRHPFGRHEGAHLDRLQPSGR
jgi:hypothetical protein